ncbi:TVP38/TMEM64 family protein [Paenibacillus hodogayensis]|uniref:TVP38/TMEM64 family membrane protein n=1 Tax=Paenibacillus hodogayensis TaxID=279208 RepID=A0ABV5VZI8_9BACL
MKLWQMIVVYAAGAILLFVYRNELADWLLEHQPSPFIAFCLALCFVLFPVLPYKIIIGTLGFLYGPWLGFVVSWSAATVASIVLFALVRSRFRQQGRVYLAKFDRMEKVSRLMEKHPFAAILAARLIPVLPQAIVNMYPALLSIRPGVYITASALGKMPAILLFSYLGQQLFVNTHNALIVIGVYAALLAAAGVGYRIWAKRA